MCIDLQLVYVPSPKLMPVWGNKSSFIKVQCCYVNKADVGGMTQSRLRT